MLHATQPILAVLCIVFHAHAAAHAWDGPDQVLRPLVSFVGADTRIARYQCVRITDRDSWVRFWLQHAGKPGRPSDYNRYRRSGAPDIDFDQCMVISITESPGQLNAGIQAVAVKESKSQITFDYDNMEYQAQAGTSAPGNAYGYFVLPRSMKPVVVRRNVQTAQTRSPPIWREVASFDALEVVDEQPVALNIVFGRDPGKGNYDGVVGEPHDTWNLLDVGQTLIESLRSRTGSKTPVRLQVSENDGEWGIKDHTGVFHAYIYHNCRCVDLQATLSGLAVGRYKLYVYAHGDAPDQNAEIELAVGSEVYGSKATVNDGSWDFRSLAFAEGVHYVSFEFAITDAEVVRIISRRSGSAYSMFNAIQIVPLVDVKQPRRP